MIKAVFFDCFGVLYPDTFWTMANEFLGEDVEHHKEELHDLMKRVDLGHITRDEFWGGFAEIVGQSKDNIYARLDEFSGLDKKLLKFIEDNKDKYKFGFISNVGHGFLERMFVDHPASYYFDSLVLSSEVGLLKPDVRIYQHAAESLNVAPEESVMIDDIPRNVEGAESAGMKAIRYTGYYQFIRDFESLVQMADSDK